MKLIDLKNKKYNFLITGGTGFIGSKLTKELLNDDQNLTILTRNQKLLKNKQSNLKYVDNISNLEFDFDIIINLAGEPISNRWTQKNKEQIYHSRIEITKKLVEKIIQSKTPPKLFISGSAIGYYGTANDQVFDENSKVNETNLFSQKLCIDWENEAKKAQDKTRLVLIRTGVVIGKNKGILAKMTPPFKLGLGGKIGSGKQILSWIHIDDEISAINHIINNEEITGEINLPSASPVSNKEFSQILAKTLKRPCFFDMPEFMAKIAFGEMGQELILNGQAVIPQKLLETGYKFKFNTLEDALGRELR